MNISSRRGEYFSSRILILLVNSFRSILEIYFKIDSIKNYSIQKINIVWSRFTDGALSLNHLCKSCNRNNVLVLGPTTDWYQIRWVIFHSQPSFRLYIQVSEIQNASRKTIHRNFPTTARWPYKNWPATPSSLHILNEFYYSIELWCYEKSNCSQVFKLCIQYFLNSILFMNIIWNWCAK